MKDKRKKYSDISKGMASGVYKAIRLIKCNEDGSRDVLLPFNKLYKPEDGEGRLQHIKMKLENSLPPGKYLVECRNSHAKHGITDEYEFIVTQRPTLQLNTAGEVKNDEEGKPLHAETMDSIDFEEYKELLRENAELKATVKLLELQLIMLKEQKAQPLNDAAATPLETGWDRAFKTLDSAMPGLIGMWEKHMGLEERRISLQEKSLPQGKKKSTHSLQTKKAMAQEAYQRKLDEIEDLLQNDPDQADVVLDQLQASNPDLYAMICEDLGIEEFDEEEGEESDD